MNEEQLLELTGTAEQVVYRNDKNGYTVLEMVSGDESVTVVGTLPMVSAGEELRLLGGWTSHPTFGVQFKAEACERKMPTSEKAILRYLSSGAVKGIGPATAGKLVDAFGEKTLEVMEKEPERLCSVKGITRQKAKKIAEEFQKIYGIREAMASLSEYGITPEEAVRIWKLWGNAATEFIQDDPYLLCEEGVGINFERADAIAASLERPQDDRCRVRAGILHVLRHNMRNGHTCLPQDKLLPAVSSFLGVEDQQVYEAFEALVTEGSLICDSLGERAFVFLPKLHQSEVLSASRLLMMLRYPAQSITGVESQIERIEREQGIEYADLQKKAIEDALKLGLLILTGGPGTGKTTTLNAIIRILSDAGEKVSLAAPTGRAAQRLSEVTGREAKTIHRLLEVEWDQNDKPVFSKNEHNLLDCDALIVDELSMVDTNLFEGLLKALPLGCRLVMVGDSDQLPSVGAGNVLSDLIHSELLPVVQLKEIFRQSMQSLIVTNAHRIVRGELPDLHQKNSDFFFLHMDNPRLISDTIVDLCIRRLPRTYGYSPLYDIQVLSPGRKGELGTFELNRQLQQALNPPDRSKKELAVGGMTLREGDKVMQIKNNYDIPWTKTDGTTGEGVFNGDVGILAEINRPLSSLTVLYDDKTAVYELENASDLELAYAVTVHKSQGSEFSAVVMPMYPGPKPLYYRNLLYTGVTRAKSMLVMVGVEQTVQTMVENNKKTKRFSGLCHFLKRGMGNEQTKIW